MQWIIDTYSRKRAAYDSSVFTLFCLIYAIFISVILHISGFIFVLTATTFLQLLLLSMWGQDLPPFIYSTTTVWKNIPFCAGSGDSGNAPVRRKTNRKHERKCSWHYTVDAIPDSTEDRKVIYLCIGHFLIFRTENNQITVKYYVNSVGQQSQIEKIGC